MSNRLNRKILKINNRTSVSQEFKYVEPMLKSIANPSIFSWSSPGKGIEGETVNAQDNNSKQIILKLRKPI